MLEIFKRKYEQIQEIRIRCNKNIIVLSGNKEYEDIYADKSYIDSIISYLTSNSVYAFKEEITEGYITLKGGIRTGICGKGVVRNGKVEHKKEISSLNIRFPREVKGCANEIFEKISVPLKNTIIISSPGCGKTTMLRDLSRSFSYSGKNVCIVDERGEIAPVYNRVCTFDMGPRCDILSSVSKSKGINMVLRAMNPDVIVVDEIGSEEDAVAVQNALNSGVKVIASFHAFNVEEFRRRFSNYKLFEYAVVLKKDKGVGEIGETQCLN